MRRNAVLIAMLFAMLWQSLALARIGSPVNALADLAHAVLHWQKTAHQHADDGSYQLDGASTSTHHVVADQAGASLAVLTVRAHAVVPAGSVAPGSADGAAAPDPLLDGLLRPPRSRA
ncbi:MAG: hypothetical protein QE285_06440 [Aquabacterium sp.]|nr:hypothetical protein [Aquabacterium sp.]